MTSGLPIFSLLIKIIDAERALSIQVHPSDERAPAGSLGKTEAWHVLDAQPGAVIYAGLQPGVDRDQVARAARSGQRLAPLLRALSAQAGMTILAPAGTVHALGAGIVVYEIQQPSAITYRLDDWRVPNDPAPPRELHIDAGLDALDPNLRPEPALRHASSGSVVEVLTTCRYFALDRITVGPAGEVTLNERDSPRTFTCLSGEVELNCAGGAVRVSAGQTAVLFAGEGRLLIRGLRKSIVLSGSVPSRDVAH